MDRSAGKTSANDERGWIWRAALAAIELLLSADLLCAQCGVDPAGGNGCNQPVFPATQTWGFYQTQWRQWPIQPVTYQPAEPTNIRLPGNEPPSPAAEIENPNQIASPGDRGDRRPSPSTSTPEKTPSSEKPAAPPRESPKSELENPFKTMNYQFQQNRAAPMHGPPSAVASSGPIESPASPHSAIAQDGGGWRGVGPDGKPVHVAAATAISREPTLAAPPQATITSQPASTTGGPTVVTAEPATAPVNAADQYAELNYQFKRMRPTSIFGASLAEASSRPATAPTSPRNSSLSGSENSVDRTASVPRDTPTPAALPPKSKISAADTLEMPADTAIKKRKSEPVHIAPTPIAPDNSAGDRTASNAPRPNPLRSDEINDHSPVPRATRTAEPAGKFDGSVVPAAAWNRDESAASNKLRPRTNSLLNEN